MQRFIQNLVLLLFWLDWSLAIPLPRSTVHVRFSSVNSPSASYTLSTIEGIAASTESAQLRSLSDEFERSLSDFGIVSRGRSLEAAPLLDETQAVIPEVPEWTSADLESLTARFATNVPLFFDTFPHQRALLDHFQLRAANHLPELRLGSIRPGSPFIRA